jgi:hypothetical protein
LLQCISFDLSRVTPRADTRCAPFDPTCPTCLSQAPHRRAEGGAIVRVFRAQQHNTCVACAPAHVLCVPPSTRVVSPFLHTCCVSLRTCCVFLRTCCVFPRTCCVFLFSLGVCGGCCNKLGVPPAVRKAACSETLERGVTLWSILVVLLLATRCPPPTPPSALCDSPHNLLILPRYLH